jgi:hypothetical protein
MASFVVFFGGLIIEKNKDRSSIMTYVDGRIFELKNGEMFEINKNRKEIN